LRSRPAVRDAGEDERARARVPLEALALPHACAFRFPLRRSFLDLLADLERVLGLRAIGALARRLAARPFTSRAFERERCFLRDAPARFLRGALLLRAGAPFALLVCVELL